MERAILEDARWDYQLDHRGEYYARIMLAIDMSSGFLAGLATADEEAQVQAAYETLVALTARGCLEAPNVLRELIARGPWQTGRALESITWVGQSAAWMDIDQLIRDRFPSDEELDAHMWYQELDEEPWRTWGKRGRPLTSFVRLRRRRIAERGGGVVGKISVGAACSVENSAVRCGLGCRLLGGFLSGQGR